MKLGLRVLTAALAIGLASAASAAPLSYTLSGTFNIPSGSGSYSGGFTYDAVTYTATNISIVTTSGLARDGTTMFSGATYDGATIQGDGGIVLVSGSTLATGTPALFIAFNPDLSTAVPAINAVSEGYCADSACVSFLGGLSNSRVSTNGVLVAPPPPVSVPTMTEWAMILFGLVLAGGAAAVVQRRRARVA